MFKKFDAAESISGTTQLKTSVQKSIRNKLAEDYVTFEPYLGSIIGKKEGGLKLIKCKEHVELLASGSCGEVLFFRHRDGPFIPTLRLLHKYPFMLPWQQVDKGAIKFVLSGAHIMCPGLTSPGAAMTDGLAPETIVAIMAEGKQHAVAIGQMKLSTEDIRAKNKGIGIETLHYLNDGLWHLQTI